MLGTRLHWGQGREIYPSGWSPDEALPVGAGMVTVLFCWDRPRKMPAGFLSHFFHLVTFNMQPEGEI